MSEETPIIKETDGTYTETYVEDGFIVTIKRDKDGNIISRGLSSFASLYPNCIIVTQDPYMNPPYNTNG